MKQYLSAFVFMTAITSCDISVNTSKSTEQEGVKDSVSTEYYASGKRNIKLNLLMVEKWR